MRREEAIQETRDNRDDCGEESPTEIVLLLILQRGYAMESPMELAGKDFSDDEAPWPKRGELTRSISQLLHLE